MPPLRRFFFLLDCSASMVGSGALARAKGYLAGWTTALRRDGAHVALVCFGGGRAEVRIAPRPLPRIVSGDTAWQDDWLAPIGGGGGTPLALGLTTVGKVRAAAVSRSAAGAGPGSGAAGAMVTEDVLVVLSDGRTAERPPLPVGFARVLLIDLETRRIALGGCAALARHWKDASVVEDAGRAWQMEGRQRVDG